VPSNSPSSTCRSSTIQPCSMSPTSSARRSATSETVTTSCVWSGKWTSTPKRVCVREVLYLRRAALGRGQPGWGAGAATSPSTPGRLVPPGLCRRAGRPSSAAPDLTCSVSIACERTNYKGPAGWLPERRDAWLLPGGPRERACRARARLPRAPFRPRIRSGENSVRGHPERASFYECPVFQGRGRGVSQGRLQTLAGECRPADFLQLSGNRRASAGPLGCVPAPGAQACGREPQRPG
jgi:hypothetical protein